MSALARLLAVLLVGLTTLSACSGASDLADAARDAIEEATAAEEPAGTYPQDGVLTIKNATDVDVCNVHITDFEEPDDEGYDLLETPLAPGESLDFPYGSHPDTDDHNLVATATDCDGTEYGDYHFSYHLGGGRYVVDEWHLKE